MSAPVEVLRGGELLIRSPQHLRLVARALDRMIATHQRLDGIGASPALRELLTATVAASRRADGMAVYRPAADTQPLGVMSNHLTTAEAAARLGISPRAVRGLCERGAIDALHRNRVWLIPAEAVLDRIANTKEDSHG